VLTEERAETLARPSRRFKCRNGAPRRAAPLGSILGETPAEEQHAKRVRR
jgi:hypothetical protein